MDGINRRMSFKRRWSLVALLLVVTTGFFFIWPWASSPKNGTLWGLQPPPPPSAQAPQRERTQQEIDFEHKQRRELRKEEFEKTKKMAADLAQMAEDLKTSIDKAGENTLPLDAVRKADAIESLAKKIRARLKEGS